MFTTLIGFAGGLAVLMSFAGAAAGRLSTHSATYHAMNLAGALAMVAAGLPARAWPSVAVNVTWALISAYGIASRATPVRRRRGTASAGGPARWRPRSIRCWARTLRSALAG
jgi:hypothetical protein